MSETVKQKTQWKGVVMLMLTALIWGSSFVAQSVGMESVEAAQRLPSKYEFR